MQKFRKCISVCVRVCVCACINRFPINLLLPHVLLPHAEHINTVAYKRTLSHVYRLGWHLNAFTFYKSFGSELKRLRQPKQVQTSPMEINKRIGLVKLHAKRYRLLLTGMFVTITLTFDCEVRISHDNKCISVEQYNNLR